MGMETEAQLLQRGVRAGVLDADKGTAALYVYSQLRQMGAQFTFGDFLIERKLISQMALNALLESKTGRDVRMVSQVADFEILEMLGEGQNGAVFRARQLSLDRVVALKILNSDAAKDKENVARFLQEARTTAKLVHPNIVQGIAVGSDGGLHYFAMEYVECGSARHLMADAGGRLPEETALEIARQVGEGLKFAHGMGLLHRDLKPDNLLLTVEGVVKLADLGISQNISRRGQAAAAGEQGETFWASPAYVAPEIVLGQAIDERSDIYSLGATLFELLAGQPLYAADTPQKVLRLQVEAPIPELAKLRPDLSAQTVALIKRMLAKDPALRIPDAATLIAAATRLLALKTQSAAPPPPPAPLPLPPRPKPPMMDAPPPPPPRSKPPKTDAPMCPPPPPPRKAGFKSGPLPAPQRSAKSSARMPAAQSDPQEPPRPSAPAAKTGTSIRRPMFPARPKPPVEPPDEPPIEFDEIESEEEAAPPVAKSVPSGSGRLQRPVFPKRPKPPDEPLIEADEVESEAEAAPPVAKSVPSGSGRLQRPVFPKRPTPPDEADEIESEDVASPAKSEPSGSGGHHRPVFPKRPKPPAEPPIDTDEIASDEVPPQVKRRRK